MVAHAAAKERLAALVMGDRCDFTSFTQSEKWQSSEMKAANFVSFTQFFVAVLSLSFTSVTRSEKLHVCKMEAENITSFTRFFVALLSLSFD